MHVIRFGVVRKHAVVIAEDWKIAKVCCFNLFSSEC